jgi:hypothetical protein
MKSIALLLFTALALPASDRTGVYAKIERVEIENDTARIHGVFAPASPDNGRDYLAPVRGYLYFKTGTNADMARKEWNDLKQIAGTGDIVAFGTRAFTTRIRKPGEKAENPDAYPVNTGIQRVRGNTDYAPVRSLLDFKN